MKRKNMKTSSIADTHLTKERISDASHLEQQRLAIQQELEQVMSEYAELTGYKRLKMRQHKVGEAPNDWRKR